MPECPLQAEIPFLIFPAEEPTTLLFWSCRDPFWGRRWQSMRISGMSWDWLVVTGTWLDYVPIYWEFHHPNWLSYFLRGVGIPPTRLWDVQQMSSVDAQFVSRFRQCLSSLWWNPHRCSFSPTMFAEKSPLLARLPLLLVKHLWKSPVCCDKT